MDMDRDKMAERILHLTLEILSRLTGEDYTVVKKTSSERCQDPVSEGWRRPLSPITRPPPHPLTHEDINDQKILELTYKMIELLTGEILVEDLPGNVEFRQQLRKSSNFNTNSPNYRLMRGPKDHIRD
ncbi:oocyte zinc finger protein XlCOF29-like [Anomaloglossus baeobatrachus]|uniref:oocyte zinc finger protein XlCOF29-like n=1 Tax=Anomaloglossus baeobatrachus TaxID=238106 RepID=UPI003F50442C